MQRKLHATISAADFVPRTSRLNTLRCAAAGCRGCPRYLRATQAVFGEGPHMARPILVGEQPGHEEDLAGHPSSGPPGACSTARSRPRIARDDTYVTNAVKHFKSTPKGKRRLHQRPNTGEVERCKPWLVAELGLMSRRTSEEGEQAFEQFCDDLRVAKRLLDKSARSRAG